MKNENDVLTLDMLKIAAEKVRETGGVVQKTKLPKRRTDSFARANKRVEKLVALFKR
ncbi:hypothetical protein [Clostridium felsineum]|uniref:hypothetical protein n=1 Tax=Clostridium felsineum TaxID=36839 RepID=UPI0009C82F3E|nr:hypothetical protein [Clostridium felsineum]URZ15489.1 hypothetical protein CLFE_015290 [Clostridium felsineum DSM 794]